MSKVLSVIIPTYNRAAYITEAIDSVLSQNFGPYEPEVIVVDDGSTDTTEEALKEYRHKITYIKSQHSGLPAVARNIGLNRAKGELVAFQDSDDVWPKDKLEKQLPAFDDKKVVMSYGQAQIMRMDGTKTKEFVVKPDILDYGESFEKLLINNSISTLTVMARREELLKIGGFNEDPNLRAVEDYDLWLRISATYPGGIRLVNSTLAYYRKHDENISRGDSFDGIIRVQNAYNSLWASGMLSDSQRRALETQLEVTHENHGHLRGERFGDPMVSVVMGVYNAEKFLRPALESILTQTFHNFEFIIIDDGSQDRTVEIIKSYNDPRIRLIHQTNHGLVFSLNKGFKLARAEYVARMDADDISLPSRFEKQLQVITANPGVAVVGAFFSYIDEAGSALSVTITAPTRHIDLVQALYIVNPFGHGSTMIRKAAWKQAGGYTDTYGPTEDYELWRRIAEKWDLAIVPESLYWYRINPEGISAQKNKAQQKFTAKIVSEQWNKPFIRKGIRQTIADGRYYKRIDSAFSEHIYHQYLHQQVLLMRQLYARRHLIAGLRIAAPLVRLRPRLAPRVARSTLGGFLHRIGVRKYG